MMKKVLLVAFSFLFLGSCVNDKKEKTEENTSKDTSDKMNDSLAGIPKGDWNGEYYEIDSDKNSVKKDSTKRKAKSRGANYFSMGKVAFLFNNQEHEINLFEQKKNAISISDKHLFAFIRSAFNETVEFRFYGTNMNENALGTYKADTSATTNGKVKVIMNLGQKGKKKYYFLTNGTVEITKFSPISGNLIIEVKGTFANKQNKNYKGTGSVNMRFETVVRSLPT